MYRTLLKSGFALIIIFLALDCNSQNNPKHAAQKIKSTVAQHTPGAVATKADGYFMKAKLDGKDWFAAYMLPDASSDRDSKLVLGENGDLSISFYVSMRGLESGTKRKFGDGNAADLRIEGANGDAYGGRKGEMIITKKNGQWIEGTFNFIANSSRSGKTIQVTNGFFRVPVK